MDTSLKHDRIFKIKNKKFEGQITIITSNDSKICLSMVDLST